MQIEIRLCSSLAQTHPAGAAFALTLPPRATLAQALARMGLRANRLNIVLCNGESAIDDKGSIDDGRVLVEGDHLVVAASDPAARRSAVRSLLSPLRPLGTLLSPLLQSHS